MSPRWDRAVDVALIVALAAVAGLAVYVLWDDWKLRHGRRQELEERDQTELAVVEDQVGDAGATPAEAGG